MNTAILTMESFQNRKPDTVGSSRLRGTWLLMNWPEAEAFKIGKKYSTVIYQKAYHKEQMKVFTGTKILDLCDPDWLEGQPIKECIDLCDAVTTSTEALADFVRNLTDKPVVCIPDRVELSLHRDRKEHIGAAKKVVWYGYAGNHKVLDQCIAAIKRLDLKLTVISDQPYMPEGGVGVTDNWIAEHIRNIRYDQETINDDLIRSGDIVLNPRIESGRFRFKSENKTVIAWSIGLPVAANAEELEALIDETARREEADRRLFEVAAKWDVKISVRQYQDLIASLHGGT